jgi:hypothetical protein
MTMARPRNPAKSLSPNSFRSPNYAIYDSEVALEEFHGSDHA